MDEHKLGILPILKAISDRLSHVMSFTEKKPFGVYIILMHVTLDERKEQKQLGFVQSVML